MVALVVVLLRPEAMAADRSVLIVFYVALISGVALGMTHFRARVEAARRAEVERLSAQLAATERLESIGRLAGGVAHDFNNLLAVMMMSAEAARAGELGALDDLTAAGERAAGLTRQLLAFSRHRVGKRTTVRVDHALAKLQPLLRRLVPENIELLVELDAAGSVELEDQQLEQLLLNLAANARDAMPKGGQLTISTSVVRVAAGAPPPRDPGEYVVIEVADTGVGIDAAVLPHVFEPFFTTKALGAGTGLGLSTVYGIVRRAGGWVDIDSAPGRGTRVLLAVPRVSPVVAAAESPPAGAEHFVGLVLLVEDEPLVRRSTCRLLERLGLTVLTAGHAGEVDAALAAAPRAIDLLITDLVMPGPTGIELARDLRRRHHGLPVLLVSGYSDQDVDDALREPATRFLAKPFTRAALAAALADLLAAGRGGQEAWR